MNLKKDDIDGKSEFLDGRRKSIKRKIILLD